MVFNKHLKKSPSHRGIKNNAIAQHTSVLATLVRLLPLDLVLECFECKNNQWTNRWITRNGLGTQLRGKQVYRDRDFLRDASRQFFSTSRNAARAREALGIGGPPMAEALRRLP